MTKSDLIDIINERIGLTKKESAEMLETVFEIIKETLEQKETVKISGFGNFVVKEKSKRIGRNPQTGEEILISKRNVLTFKPSQILRN